MDADPIIYVVDDDSAMRDSLRFLISSLGIEVQTFEGPAAFLAHFQAARPSCLVVDLRMPGMSGLELHDHLRSRNMRVPTVIITGHGDVPAAVRAFRAGVADFLEKPFSDEQLLVRIQDLLRDDIAARRQRRQVDETRKRISALTKRESEVLELVVAGKPNKQIAIDLGVGIKAIEAHRSRLMEKMGADSVQQLVSAVTIARQLSNA